MKIIAFNGSPKKEGNTYIALQFMADIFAELNIETEIVQVGKETVSPCIACGACFKNRNERCIQEKDSVNHWIQLIKDAHGVVLASPVHYSDITGSMKSFLDRAFYVSSGNGNLFRHKVGASVAVVRRAGGLPAFQQLNNYLLYGEFMIPASNYWNVIYGTMPGEVLKDEEGKEILRVLCENYAWLLKITEHGKKEILPPPLRKKIYTNFIRKD